MIVNIHDDALEQESEFIDKIDKSNILNSSIDSFIKEHNLDPTFINFIDELMMPFIFYTDKIPYVAGGYLRRWMQQEKFENLSCDIDIYMNGVIGDETCREKFIEYLTTQLIAKNVQDDKGFKNNSLFIDLNGQKIEFQIMNTIFNINSNFSSSIKKHLMTYDSYCSMALYDFKTRRIHYHKKFPSHAKEKIYEFNNSCRSISPVTQYHRLDKFKFEKYQFTQNSVKDFLEWAVKNKERIGREDEYNQ